MGKSREQGCVPNRPRASRLVVILASGIILAPGLAASSSPSQPALDYRAGSLAKDEPQAVYAADPDDAWNHIFYCLFTRTIQTRLSADFKEGKPFDLVGVMGYPKLPISRRS